MHTLLHRLHTEFFAEYDRTEINASINHYVSFPSHLQLYKLNTFFLIAFLSQLNIIGHH